MSPKFRIIITLLLGSLFILAVSIPNYDQWWTLGWFGGIAAGAISTLLWVTIPQYVRKYLIIVSGLLLVAIAIGVIGDIKSEYRPILNGASIGCLAVIWIVTILKLNPFARLKHPNRG